VDARLHATVALIPSIRGNHRRDLPLYPPSAPQIARRYRELAPRAMRRDALQRVREQSPRLQTVVTIFHGEGEKCLHDFFMRPAASDHAPVPFH
jgi:hypothetical protein